MTATVCVVAPRTVGIERFERPTSKSQTSPHTACVYSDVLTIWLSNDESLGSFESEALRVRAKSLLDRVQFVVKLEVAHDVTLLSRVSCCQVLGDSPRIRT